MSADGALVYWDAVTTTSSDDCQTSYQTATTHGGSGELLLAVYGGYCRAVFERLAQADPDELVSIIKQNRTADSRLTFAVEILGRDVDRPWVAGALMDILRTHRSPLVREGAVLGLLRHLDRIGVRDALREIVARDPSEGVKATAQDILDGE